MICLLTLALILLQANPAVSYVAATESGFVLRNDHISLHISTISGQHVLEIQSSTEPRTHYFSLNFIEKSRMGSARIQEPSVIESYPQYGEVRYKTDYLHEAVDYCFRIDSTSIYCEVEIISKNQTAKETELGFSISNITDFDYLFYPGSNAIVPVKQLKPMSLKYREHMHIPMLSLYSISGDYGLTFVAPFEIPKPGLEFLINKDSLVVSYHHLMLTNKKKTKIALYIAPHAGDWRPGLNYVLTRYPSFFNAFNENTSIGEGWYYLANPFDDENRIEDVAKRGVTWIEFHGHFPFYGLYAPQKRNWGLLYNTDQITLSEWENGRGEMRNGYDKMNSLIDSWHEHGIKTYLYFQVFEAWHQYAERLFREDIAINESGKPIPAWQFCNLMNPNPAGRWGLHIINQAKEIILRYPAIDGVFYDRMDYCTYDYAHRDGSTMVDNKDTYMLGHAMESLNERLFSLFHENGISIWGNAPSSIEVCKNLDGVMAEGSVAILNKFKYLGLARPIVYLPYDKQPEATEEKLKYSLLCGAFPSITDGGRECQLLDEKYRPLFELMTNRKWVLTRNPIEAPKGFECNIFRTDDGGYALILIGSRKPRSIDPLFTYNTQLIVNVPDANQIENAYLLSGDWVGVNRLEFEQTQSKITVNLPFHLSCSMIYLSKGKKYDLTRLSSPVLIKGQNERLVFRLEADGANESIPLEMVAPWFRKTARTKQNVVTFQTYIPAEIEGEINTTIRYGDEEHKMSFWVLDPTVITPREDIFIWTADQKVRFAISNNTPVKTTVGLKSRFTQGTGTVVSPMSVVLKPFDDKDFEFTINTKEDGIITINMETQGQKIERSFSLKSRLFRGKNELFSDNFANGMKKWTRIRGEWQAKRQIAIATGPSHLAFVKKIWQDYVVQVTTRCKGSNDPAVDWIKSYIFFRVQDESNFYRFGIHGDAGLIDLLKFVDGVWVHVGSAPFSPQKDRWYTLKTEVKGTSITGYIDGKKIIEATDDTFVSGGIGIGVLEDNMVCEYRDVIVRKL